MKNPLLLTTLLLFFINTPSIANDTSSPHLAKAVFTSKISNRVPKDDLIEAENTVKKIYFFTDVRNLANTTITHRWFYKDRLMAEVPLKIGGNRWRTWSSKNIWHTWLGQWHVEVVSQDKEVLVKKFFEYYK